MLCACTNASEENSLNHQFVHTVARRAMGAKSCATPDERRGDRAGRSTATRRHDGREPTRGSDDAVAEHPRALRAWARPRYQVPYRSLHSIMLRSQQSTALHTRTTPSSSFTTSSMARKGRGAPACPAGRLAAQGLPAVLPLVCCGLSACDTSRCTRQARANRAHGARPASSRHRDGLR